ncbi:uncharacterized protein LOC141631191 [Silene latifolia]|uniref:uncharacterized protein LOC141631191 n=1 Tax=Silene latifolia TaxID=37657 RepID=UPI003D78AFA9
MARLSLSKRKKIVVTYIVIYRQMLLMVMETIVELLCLLANLNSKIMKSMTYVFDNSIDERIQARLLNLRSIIHGNDVVCFDNLRMDRSCFEELSYILEEVERLYPDISIQFFLPCLDVIIFCSRNLNRLLKIAKMKDETNCLGALDGTHIKLRVGGEDKVRFRTRRGELTTNVLAACTRDMQFVYLLPGWEGSTHDNRILRDALSRNNPLRVSQGYYYLCDAGYMNCEGFLTPFRGSQIFVIVMTTHSRWSSVEDQALVSAMQDLLVLGGWKADNGQFKNGAYSKIETLLEEKLPGCGKRAKPHIESRVKTLRKQFDAITDMLSPQASGFGWNDEQKFVTCEHSVWEAWLKSQKNAVGLRNRPFPLYDELAKIWGKDRANGNEGGSVQDALEEMENEVRGEQEEIEEEEIHISNTSGMSSTEVEASPSSAPVNKKTKKARTETIEALREFSGQLNKMTDVMKTAGEHIGRLANSFKHESESADRRMQVISEVMKIEGLTRAEVIFGFKKSCYGSP